MKRYEPLWSPTRAPEGQSSGWIVLFGESTRSIYINYSIFYERLLLTLPLPITAWGNSQILLPYIINNIKYQHDIHSLTCNRFITAIIEKPTCCPRFVQLASQQLPKHGGQNGTQQHRLDIQIRLNPDMRFLILSTHGQSGENRIHVHVNTHRLGKSDREHENLSPIPSHPNKMAEK